MHKYILYLFGYWIFELKVQLLFWNWNFCCFFLHLRLFRYHYWYQCFFFDFTQIVTNFFLKVWYGSRHRNLLKLIYILKKLKRKGGAGTWKVVNSWNFLVCQMAKILLIKTKPEHKLQNSICKHSLKINARDRNFPNFSQWNQPKTIHLSN